MLHALFIGDNMNSSLELADFVFIIGMFLSLVVILLVTLILNRRIHRNTIREQSVDEKLNKALAEQKVEQDQILSKLTSLSEAIQDTVRTNTYFYRDTLLGLLYTVELPILKRLIAYNDYVKLGGDGGATLYAKDLILDNKDDWQTVVRDHYDHVMDDKNEYYNKIIAEINRQLFN